MKRNSRNWVEVTRIKSSNINFPEYWPIGPQTYMGHLQKNGPNGGLKNSAFLKSFQNFLLVLEVAYYNVLMLFIKKF